MSASMAEVLAEHGGFEFDAITNPKTVTCFCQQWTVSWERDGGYVDTARKVDAAFWAHQEAMLAANGYGKLEDAWDEGHYSGEWNYIHRRMIEHHPHEAKKNPYRQDAKK